MSVVEAANSDVFASVVSSAALSVFGTPHVDAVSKSTSAMARFRFRTDILPERM